MDPGFGEAVRGLLKRTGAPGNRLIFEITEGVWIQDVEATARRMRELNRLGIRFSIDDFGTGYSNLSCLMRLPIFELKIDQSLIRNLPDDPDSIAIARLILAMAGQLDFWVVAEAWKTSPRPPSWRSTAATRCRATCWRAPCRSTPGSASCASGAGG
jgi:EAL domain-containing protein (putative c-di-GMP-specific phosphodiesterase class I)